MKSSIDLFLVFLVQKEMQIMGFWGYSDELQGNSVPFPSLCLICYWKDAFSAIEFSVMVVIFSGCLVYQDDYVFFFIFPFGCV